MIKEEPQIMDNDLQLILFDDDYDDLELSDQIQTCKNGWDFNSTLRRWVRPVVLTAHVFPFSLELQTMTTQCSKTVH